jgi:pyruvate dehydrogenase E2 component (dihydrolipoamide acetyltransferase)
VNTIITRPADLGNGVFGFVPYIGLSLTYDHRALDGAPASSFLRDIRLEIENLDINI